MIEVVLCENCWDFFTPGERVVCGKCRYRLVRYSIPPEQMKFLYHRRLKLMNRKSSPPAGDDLLDKCRLPDQPYRQRS
jgi:hypothetical protein